MNAMLQIEKLLLSTGLSQDDVDDLICRFLEEEAFNYVECCKLMNKDKDIKKKSIKHMDA